MTKKKSERQKSWTQKNLTHRGSNRQILTGEGGRKLVGSREEGMAKKKASG